MSAGTTPTMPAIADPQDALRLVGVSKVYGSAIRVTALRGVSLAFPAGSFTAVMGPSGSGKSTLLQCAAGLDAPTSGQVFVGGEEVPQGDEAGLTEFRRERVGFVFQHQALPVPAESECAASCARQKAQPCVPAPCPTLHNEKFRPQ